MGFEEFYRIEDFTESETAIDASIFLNGSHWIYSAHFPGHPVTPGAMLLEILADIVSKRAGRRMRLESSCNIRFYSIIDPAAASKILYRIEYVLDSSGAMDVRCKVTTSKSGNAAAKMDCRFINS